jgi:hypothetical protein
MPKELLIEVITGDKPIFKNAPIGCGFNFLL